MNCPNCNAPLGEGALFCGQCGADLRNYQPGAAAQAEAEAPNTVSPVEQPWQQAPELDEELTVREYPTDPGPDANAIPAGESAPAGGYYAPYPETPAYDPNQIPPYQGIAQQAPGTDPNAYQSMPQFDPNSIPPLQDPGVYQPGPEPAKPKKEKKPKEGKSKKPLIIAICAALAVLLIAVGVIMILKGGSTSGGGSSKKAQGFSKYALYFKDGELFYSDLKKEPWQVTDNLLPDDSWGSVSKDDGSGLNSYIVITKDGKTIYYPDKLRGDRDEGFTLFSRPLAAGESGEVKKIDSHVTSFILNEAGTLITYKSASGTLYQYDVKTDEKTKLATDILYFSASRDGKIVFYENEDYTLFAIPQGKDKIKITTDVGGYQIMSDNKTLYYTKNDTLYRQVIGDDKEKIVSDVYSYHIFEDGKIYYIKME